MFSVLLGVLATTGNVLFDKFLLSKQKMQLSNYIPLLFGFLFLVTAVTLPWTYGIDNVLAGNQQYIFYFLLMIMLAVVWNIFYYQGLQKESMIEFEMITMLTPLATVILAAFFYPEEFNGAVFGASIVASLALIFSHVRQRHLKFDSYAIQLILAVVLIAMESMVQKELLNIYSPALLYAIRTAFLALFFAIYYRPNMHQVSNRQFGLIFWTAIFGAASMVLKFWGFESLGLTLTTLLFMIAPILTTLLDAKINGTKIHHRQAIAFTIILACVIYATIFRI